MSNALLEVVNLKVYFYTLSGVVRAVDDVSLSVLPGEWIGIVGESGSGKSTLAYAIAKIVPPPGRIVGGKVKFMNRDLMELNEEAMRGIRGRHIGFVFQDPLTSLDPLRTVGDQLAEVIQVHLGVGREEAIREAGELLELVNIPRDRLNYYPHQLSGGQRQRIVIAISIALRPELLIADEPTTALDVIVQDQIMDLLKEVQMKGASIMLITHDVALAAEMANRIAIMYAGEIVEYGDTRSIINAPLHPYTAGLVNSVPDLWSAKTIKSIPGFPPDLRNPSPGCRFHPRCRQALSICINERPPMTIVEHDRCIACWLYLKR
ncbi:MAG: ABC transporter ATP-binding protein [Sulfolobales archaeon]|nr:ABC transporter ATP-binding protein [Sulfolobales archaeon]MCX8199022.1 ABC transporter ATP-binding protein [Sulfolobales archaeon]MDW8170001.1 ABC transporter ATP-binding protein [Desulfurococcaceae archaeon]